MHEPRERRRQIQEVLRSQKDLMANWICGLRKRSRFLIWTAGYMILPSLEIKNTGGGAGFQGRSEEEEGAMMRSVWDVLSFSCLCKPSMEKCCGKLRL